MTPVEDEFQPVKSADRTLEVLEVLAASPVRRSLVDLSRTLEIPKSSLHGILRTMARRGWVETDGTGTRFGLGVRALEVGAAYVDADDAVSLLAGVLDDLSRQFGEAVHLGRLDGPDVVYLAKRESVHRLRLYSAIGRRLPAHATGLGKALLAQYPDPDVFLRWPLAALTPLTITDREAFRVELDRVRARGYAVDREENTEGIICFAMAVPLRDGVPAADAISVSVPTARVEGDTEALVSAALGRAVKHLRAARSLLPE
jgi:DNA-binding IclR family transcriptional regulator